MAVNTVTSFASPTMGGGSAAAGTTMRLATLGSGVLFFHVMNSILQEAVFHLPGFNHSLILSFMQTMCIAGFALFEFKRANQRRRAPLLTYFFLSLFSTTSVILTNEASRRLNYPTQVIFKSSKLLFVMTVRWLVMRGTAKKKKRLTMIKEIVSSILIVLGLVIFTYATSAAKMAGKTKAPTPSNATFDPNATTHPTSGGLDTKSSADVLFGVVAIVIALICDALLYIGEERFCFSAHDTSNTEVILFLNTFAAVVSSFSLVSSGQALESIAYVIHTPIFVGLVLAFSVCNFCGTHFLLHIVSEFDSNSAVMVTSVRKMFTVLCSFLVYPKPFTGTHFVGLVAVSYGIWLHENTRAQAKKEEKELAKMDDSSETPV